MSSKIHSSSLEFEGKKPGRKDIKKIKKDISKFILEGFWFKNPRVKYNGSIKISFQKSDIIDYKNELKIKIPEQNIEWDFQNYPFIKFEQNGNKYHLEYTQ